MAPFKKIKRSSFRKALRARAAFISEAHDDKIRFKNDSADLVIYLNYVLFINSIVNEIKLLKEKDNSNDLNLVHLNNIKEKMLKKFKG
ncbi:uncharacterized protein ASCRUDRAFT_75188 [Ascoidea rubescens DSM 1968]|uniref:Transcription factor CBF/NF-Y/archaeal histone domain-containing protein n=1 Tax=Ascoidea rubescens DSM 1968 TaxID=1344418 RepID=A0A1D2VK04_9ASCO|nr:hypothetical protein ASCRUDRAFT_75188 [Ascoidea rubescens DSM 1968]ODV61934.1 hypothetical protein ASCRUDRAFT_75188 [Ascoidea rubescens DSM 1968]